MDLQNRDVGVGVLADEPCLAARPVGKRRPHGLGVMDHVAVRQKIAIGGYEKAGARAGRTPAPRDDQMSDGRGNPRRRGRHSIRIGIEQRGLGCLGPGHGGALRLTARCANQSYGVWI